MHFGSHRHDIREVGLYVNQTAQKSLLLHGKFVSKHIPWHVNVIDVDEASNITATKKQPLKSSPAYETTDSSHKRLPMLILQTIIPWILLKNPRDYRQNSFSLVEGTKSNTPKNLAQYIDYVNVHHPNIRLPHVVFGSSTNKL